MKKIVAQQNLELTISIQHIQIKGNIANIRLTCPHFCNSFNLTQRDFLQNKHLHSSTTIKTTKSAFYAIFFR